MDLKKHISGIELLNIGQYVDSMAQGFDWVVSSFNSLVSSLLLSSCFRGLVTDGALFVPFSLLNRSQFLDGPGVSARFAVWIGCPTKINPTQIG